MHTRFPVLRLTKLDYPGHREYGLIIFNNAILNYFINSNLINSKIPPGAPKGDDTILLALEA